MSRQLVGIVAAAFSTVCLYVSVSSADEVKFGFVNTQGFMIKSAKAQAQRKKLLDLYQAKKEALEKQGKKLQDLKNEMSGQYPALEKEARSERVKQLALKRTEFNLSEREAKKLGLVFNSSAVLAADESLDLTGEVASAYDEDPSIPSKPSAVANPAAFNRKPVNPGPGGKPQAPGAK